MAAGNENQKANSDPYREGHDRIFGKKKPKDSLKEHKKKHPEDERGWTPPK